MRQKFEFCCTSCSKYFDFVMNTKLNGNYRIHCPNCGHIHYRVVQNGQITDTRFPENDSSVLIEDIIPMKHSCRDYQTEKAEDLAPTEKGFLHRLWKQTIGVQ